MANSTGEGLQANSVGAAGVIATSFGAMAPTIGIALGVQLVDSRRRSHVANI